MPTPHPIIIVPTLCKDRRHKTTENSILSIFILHKMWIDVCLFGYFIWLFKSLHMCSNSSWSDPHSQHQPSRPWLGTWTKEAQKWPVALTSHKNSSQTSDSNMLAFRILFRHSSTAQVWKEGKLWESIITASGAPFGAWERPSPPLRLCLEGGYRIQDVMQQVSSSSSI